MFCSVVIVTKGNRKTIFKNEKNEKLNIKNKMVIFNLIC